jgi:hypothetical protein
VQVISPNEQLVIRWTRGAQTVDRGSFLFSIKILFAATVRSTSLRLTAFFGSPYVCEEALSQMKITQDTEAA